jgi:hypothetical protein
MLTSHKLSDSRIKRLQMVTEVYNREAMKKEQAP